VKLRLGLTIRKYQNNQSISKVLNSQWVKVTDMTMPKVKWVNMYLDLAITNLRVHLNRKKCLNIEVVILGKRKSLKIL